MKGEKESYQPGYLLDLGYEYWNQTPNIVQQEYHYLRGFGRESRLSLVHLHQILTRTLFLPPPPRPLPPLGPQGQEWGWSFNLPPIAIRLTSISKIRVMKSSEQK